MFQDILAYPRGLLIVLCIGMAHIRATAHAAHRFFTNAMKHMNAIPPIMAEIKMTPHTIANACHEGSVVGAGVGASVFGTAVGLAVGALHAWPVYGAEQPAVHV